MEIYIWLFLAFIFFTFADSTFAQHRKLTVILFRHAEKDLSENANTANPELSSAGVARAIQRDGSAGASNGLAVG